MTGPLAGVRVLDLSTTFSGPYCTRQLADLGADVVKVEAPAGDVTRGLGTSREPGLASVYIAANHGKASLLLDLKSDRDAAYLDRLVERADALVHNMRPAAAKRLGVDPGRALVLTPRLIHLTITGFGSDGPYAGRAAYDDTIQALSGLAWLQGRHTEPTYVAAPVADKVSGLTGALALVAALYERGRTGRGRAIEVPMFETMVGFNLMEQWGGRAFLPPEGDTGYPRIRSPFRRPYRTKDGVLSVVVYHDGHWRRFLDAVGQVHLLELAEFRTTAARNQNIDRLYERLADTMTTRTTAEWIELLDSIDVPVSRLQTLDQLFDDEHLRAVGFFEQNGTDDDRYLVSRPAPLFDGSPLPVSDPDRSPDRLGDGATRAAAWLEEQ